MLAVFFPPGWRLGGLASRAGRLVVSVAILLSVACPVAGRELLLIGPPWPPYLDDTDPHKGFATEIVKAALKASGYDTITVRLQPWRRVVWNARNQTADGLIGVWHTKDREALVAFSQPYFLSPIVALLPAGTDLAPRHFNDLAGLRIAYREGARFGADFDQADTLNKLPVDTTSNVVQMLARGRVDAGVEDQLVAKAIVEANPTVKGKVRLSAPLLTQPLYFGVVKGKPHSEELLEHFNRGLNIIRLNGEYGQILRAYGLSDALAPLQVPERRSEITSN